MGMCVGVCRAGGGGKVDDDDYHTFFVGWGMGIGRNTGFFFMGPGGFWVLVLLYQLWEDLGGWRLLEIASKVIEFFILSIEKKNLGQEREGIELNWGNPSRLGL